MRNTYSWALIIVTSTLFSFNANASPLFEGPDFSAKVTKVSNGGVVYFENRGGYRLWGLLPDADYLRELLVGKELACYEAGELSGYSGGVFITSRSAVCISLDFSPDPFLPEGLAAHLLETGNAIEFCAETLGFWGTCAARSFD